MAKPPWEKLSGVFESNEAGHFSGVVDKDGRSSVGQHVTDNMTPEQRGLYSVYWTCLMVRAAMATTFRDLGATATADEISAMPLKKMFRTAYDALSDDEWEEACAARSRDRAEPDQL